jgi:hypothetical protein
VKPVLGQPEEKSKAARRAPSAEQLHCLAGHIASEHTRLAEIDPTSPRIRATLPAVSLLTDSEPPQPRPRNSHIFELDPYGHYVDEPWCSARLFETEDFGEPGASVLDPACGWGTIPRAARDAGFTPFASDIIDRRDEPHSVLGDISFKCANFLKDEPPIRAPWSVVCNPPFNHIQEFCERALDLATFKVAMLIPVRRLSAAGKWLNRLPLQDVVFLSPRPSMPPASYLAAGNRPGNGREDFAWLIFSKATAATAGGRPHTRWLYRDRNG